MTDSNENIEGFSYENQDKRYYTVVVKNKEDKDRLRHDLTCCTEGLANIPDRECSCEDTKKFSGQRATYLLSEQEAEELKRDNRVKSINIDIRYYDDMNDEIVHFSSNPIHVKNRYNSDDYPMYSVFGLSNSNSEIQQDAKWSSYLNNNTQQIYRLQQKENPWIVNNLSRLDFIEHTPTIRPLQHKGAGEDVDIIINDLATWHGHVEFNQNAINAKNPRDYRNGNALREVSQSNGANGTCNVLDIYLDAPALIDPDFFYDPSEIEERTIVRWDGTRLPAAPAAIDWWNNNSLDYRSPKYVSPENGGTATGDNDFGEIYYVVYDDLRDYVHNEVSTGEFARVWMCGRNDINCAYPHGTECAGLAYGRTFGWAYNANKWSLSIGAATNDFESNCDIIKIFHKLKPTPSNKSEKNPTIVSSSVGLGETIGNVQDPVFGAEGKYFTWRGETTEAPLTESLNNHLSGMSYTLFEIEDDSMTQAGDELIEAGVIYIQAAANGNSNIVKPDHPNFNNFLHTDSQVQAPGPAIQRGARNVFLTTSRRGFPMHIGKTEDYEYPAILVGALDDFIYEGKEIKADYSSNGNGIDLWAPADGTLAPYYYDPNPLTTGYIRRIDDTLPSSDLRSINVWFSGTSAATPIAAGFLTTLIAHHRDWDWRDLKKWINEELVGQPKDQFYNEGGDPDSPDDPAWNFNPVPTGYSPVAGSINTFLPDGELPKIPYLSANFDFNPKSSESINTDMTQQIRIKPKHVTINNVSAADVKLENVDNTSDLNKPISISTQSALDLKADQSFTLSQLSQKADTSTTYTKTEVDDAITDKVGDLIGNAPAGLDTLKELATALNDNSNFASEVTALIDTKWTEDNTKISNWDAAHSWGDHRQQGYLSSASTVLWDEAFSWGDHRKAGYKQNLDNVLDNGSLTARDITTTGKIYYSNVFAELGDLPAANTYHGMFAHVHSTGKAYFAHSGQWVQLADIIDLLGVYGRLNTAEADITDLQNDKANLNNPTFTGDSTRFNDRVTFDERVEIKPASGLGLKLETSGTSKSAVSLDVRGTAKVGHDLFKHSGFTNGFGSGSNHFHSIFRINRIEQVDDQDQVWIDTGGDVKNIERAQERYYATQTNVLRNNSAAFWAWHRVARPINSPTINTNNATLDVGLLEISPNRDSEQQKLWSLNTVPDGKSEKITINNLVNHTFSVGDHVRMEFSVSFPGPIVASKRFGKVTDVDDANTLRVELYGGNYKTTAEVPVPAGGVATQTALPFTTEDGDRHVILEKIENSSAINSGDEDTLVFYDKNNFTPARLKNETVKATWTTAHGLIRNEHVTIMLDGSTFNQLVPAESGWVLDPDPDGDGLSAILIYGGRRTKQYNIPSAFSDFAAGQWRIYKGTLDGTHQDVIGDNLLTFVSDNVGNYKAYEIGPGCQADSDCISFGRSIYNKDSKTIKIGYDKPMLDVRSDGVIVEEDLTVKGDIIAEGVGAPELISQSNIVLTAATRVETNVPIKLANLSTVERDATSAENGDMIYNTTEHRPEIFVDGSTWSDFLNIGDFTFNTTDIDTVGNAPITVNPDTTFTGTVTITDLASVGTGNLEFSSAASVNITAVDDVNISGTARFSDIFELPPLSSAPVAPTAGTFATADLTNWDPAAKGTGRAYPVFYDGAVWQPLY